MAMRRAGLVLGLSSLLLSASAFAEGTDLGTQETEIGGAPPQSAAAQQGQQANQPAAASQQQASNVPQVVTAGQMVWVQGTVKATFPDQQPRVLARGSLIYEKDTLNTDANSTGEISFTDNTVVTLRQSTTFVIEQYYFDQQKPTSGAQYFMNLLKGGFRTITGFIAKTQPENYQVKTPVATIGVRGTDYQATCPLLGGQCAFGLLHGKGVILTNGAGVFELTAATPYATVASQNSPAEVGALPPAIMEKLPAMITAPTAPPPKGTNPPPGVGGGNCGILIQ